MAWRVHLMDDSIYRLDILKGTPDVLCAWLRGDYAAFFNLETGAALGRQSFSPPPGTPADRSTNEWKRFLDTLAGPNDALLPVVRLRTLTIHSTDDGRQRLYDDGHGLTVHLEDTELPLGTADTHFTSVAMDRVMGVTAALDEDGKLHIFQQHIPVGAFDIGLQLQENILPDLVLADNAAAIFASDGTRLVRANSGGTPQKTRPMPYFVNRLACSRDGERCVTSDSEAGILRVYEGQEMAFTHQKFAIDLYAAAEPVQLMEDVPTPRLAVSALALSDEGVLAFAMEGIITVTPLAKMEKMPRPQSLL